MIFLVFILLLLSDIITTAPAPNSTNGDASPCLEEFYKAAHALQFNCTGEYDFFSNDLTVQHNSFKTGKDCFLLVIKAVCTPAQYDLISTKYEGFLSILTTEPINDPGCTSLYYSYNLQRCIPQMQQIGMDVMKFSFIQTEINDSRVLDFIDMCYDTKECIAPACNLPDIAKNGITQTCEGIEMKNSEYFVCTAKIQTGAPDLSGYKCLEGANYYDTSMKAQTDLWTNKKECVKEIFADLCGPAAIENFDTYSELTIKGFQVLTTFGMAVGGQ